MPGSTSSLRWTLSGFLEHIRFVHTNMRDHAYAWVLGAGASRSSGIPLAGELVQRWLNELHRRLDHSRPPLALAEWATAENLDIQKFDYKTATSFYSRVYERRFGDNPDEGFADLEALMSNKDPSPGYSILAQVLDKTSHKVVISTNFDNLVADALSIYTETFPLVIGHESLANFVRVVSRRPVICKIHRDLLLGPKNDHRSLRRLHESWAAALRALFSQHTPLFIGYGGNDDSLMDLLESLDPEDIKGQLIWCYHERFEPSERIVSLVQQHKGALVPVPDFDLLMVLIGDQMGIEPIDDTIEKRAAKRARQYREQLIKLDTTTYPDVRRILRGAFERAGGTLAWLEKAAAEPSTERREQIFEQALEQYPDDLSLQLTYAEFLLFHCIEVQRCRDMLTKLQAHDQELDYSPSFYLAQRDLFDDRLDGAKKTLAGVPESPSKHLIAGRIEEIQGDIASAEAMYRMAHANDHRYGFDLADFLFRQDRMDECETLLKTLHSKEQGLKGAAPLALFQWKVHKNIDAAVRLLANVSSSESEDTRDLAVVASLDLVKGDVDSCKKVLATLEFRPKADWEDEVCVEFIGLVHQLLAGSQGERSIQRLRALLARPHSNFLRGLEVIDNLAESMSPKLPKPHKKFILALAEAYYDPGRLTALGVYPQWRPADGAT
jgi:hypothetical protein